jgi:hypothetical protein
MLVMPPGGRTFEMWTTIIDVVHVVCGNLGRAPVRSTAWTTELRCINVRLFFQPPVLFRGIY